VVPQDAVNQSFDDRRAAWIRALEHRDFVL
jgi:hypothetical protein